MHLAPIFTLQLDFSGVYDEENFRPEGAVRIGLTDLRGTECYCDPDSAAEIRRRIAEAVSARSGEASGDRAFPIHWIDGGDYHYASHFWLERIGRPFCLVLIDHHPDDQSGAFGGDLLSCGGWVADARRDLPALRWTFWINGPGQALRLPDLPVYLSIDKDVLSKEYASTNWDQGSMTLAQLKETVCAIAAQREILGIDVCGELSAAKGAVARDYAINRATNLELQDFFVSLQTNQSLV